MYLAISSFCYFSKILKIFCYIKIGRPWLEDNLDDWIYRLQNGQPHKCAAIFIDNSGVDIILGILPFARDLLQRGTKVSSIDIIILESNFLKMSFIK